MFNIESNLENIEVDIMGTYQCYNVEEWKIPHINNFCIMINTLGKKYWDQYNNQRSLAGYSLYIPAELERFVENNIISWNRKLRIDHALGEGENQE